IVSLVPAGPPTGVPTAAPPRPQVAPTAQATPSGAYTSSLRLTFDRTTALSGVIAASFALVVFGLLGVALVLVVLSGLRRGPAGRHIAPLDGADMNPTRSRLYAGLSVLALAAVVGGIGWYQVSGEPLVNRQIPFLASAGILAVLLSVLGGSLIVAEQLRGDQSRIDELEQAVRSLTEALAPMIESPPRHAPVATSPQKRAPRRRAPLEDG
nr:hypothetical protein [Actinomycetota bacterium]